MCWERFSIIERCHWTSTRLLLLLLDLRRVAWDQHHRLEVQDTGKEKYCFFARMRTESVFNRIY